MIPRRTVAALLATAITAAVLTVSAAAATVPADTDTHCLAETTSGDGSVLDMTVTDCFTAFDDVLVRLDAPDEIVGRVDHPSELTDEDMAVLGPRGDGLVGASSFALGIHFDGAGYTGASFTVSGDDCAGGYVNVSASWNNRVSSTLNGCPVVGHFNGQNLTGTSQTTTGGGGTLTYMDNRTSSIQYRT